MIAIVLPRFLGSFTFGRCSVPSSAELDASWGSHGASLIKIHTHGFWEDHTTCEETLGTLFGQSSQEVRAARLLGASAFPFKINQSTNRCPLFPTDRWGSGLANCTESDFPSFWTLNVWEIFHWGYLILTQGHLSGKEVCSLFLTQEVGND